MPPRQNKTMTGAEGRGRESSGVEGGYIVASGGPTKQHTGSSGARTEPIQVISQVQAHPQQPHSEAQTQGMYSERGGPAQGAAQGQQSQDFNRILWDIYGDVVRKGTYIYLGARRRVPSGLALGTWERRLADYPDKGIVDFLAYGWPVNFDRRMPLQATFENHPSATRYPADIADGARISGVGRSLLGAPYIGVSC